jgi:hypothetical protein
MSATDPAPTATSSLIARVQGILMTPKAEWEKIDLEAATPQSLFTGYAMILAAIPAIARVIGSFFPVCVLGICVHVNPIFAVVGAVVSYVIGLVGVYVVALIASELAPSFGGVKNQTQALKLVVYSWTAAWLAGIFGIIPMLAILGILGLYSIYLMYVGAPTIMKTPADKALGYTAVTFLIAIVVFFVVGAVGGAVAGMGMIGAGGLVRPNISSVSGTMNVGGASVDLGKLDAAAKALQANAQAAQTGTTVAGAVKPIALDTLKALLPANLPSGFARTEVSATSAGVSGMSGSAAEGVYTRGDGRITLQVTDLAAAGPLGALAGAMNVESSKETATGYEKVGKIDGRLTTEEFDRQAKSGKFSVLVADRFLVDAEGSGIAIDDLKGAVSTVGIDRLESLAHA